MRRWILIAAGLAAGLLVGFLLPRSWLFVPEEAPMDHTGHDGAQYACPMFCVVMDRMPADKKCPVCGMTMTVMSGKSALNVQEQRMTGLEVATLRHVALSRHVRVVGEVDYDETRLSRITTRASGWLEKVWIDTTWMPVRKGDKLAAFYSPELYAAQKEYLVGGPLREAAARRLRLLGVSAEEIQELDRAGKVQESLVLRAPRTGVVIERHAVEGASVQKGALLYAVADLSRVWVQAEVFEADLVWIFAGQPVRLEVESHSDPISGTIAFVDPAIDRRARTARIRIEVDNSAGLLRIGQRVDAWIEAHVDAAGRPSAKPVAQAPLAVPRSAVLRTGTRSVVYFLFTEFNEKRDYALDPKRLPDDVLYEMVSLRLGPLATGPDGTEFYPVLGLAQPGGELKEGMAVVTRGNLLLDSQAQLTGKPSLLFPEGRAGAESGDPHAGH